MVTVCVKERSNNWVSLYVKLGNICRAAHFISDTVEFSTTTTQQECIKLYFNSLLPTVAFSFHKLALDCSSTLAAAGYGSLTRLSPQ